MYLNTNDVTLNKHIQSINKVYTTTCEYLNLQPEKHEITLDLVFKPNLKLIHKDIPIMIYTENINIERYNEIDTLLEKLNYEEFIKQFGNILFVTRETDSILINFNTCSFIDIINKSINIYKDKIETRVSFYNSSINESIFRDKYKKTSFTIYDLRRKPLNLNKNDNYTTLY
jgi:hypothetical protein